MEIRVQKCQNCESTELKNIIFRESGEPDRIYAQCHKCKEFVASYVIAPLGYYHNGRGFESFLRGMNRSGEFMSGHRVKKLFANRETDEQATFNEVIKRLEEKERKRDAEK